MDSTIRGGKFDPQGNLHDWWTEQDAKEFEKRADCEVQRILEALLLWTT